MNAIDAVEGRRRVTPSEASIVESLIAVRLRSGLSTGEVARRMQVTSPAVSQLESGHRRGKSLTLDRLLRYANAIGAELHVVTPIGGHGE